MNYSHQQLTTRELPMKSNRKLPIKSKCKLADSWSSTGTLPQQTHQACMHCQLTPSQQQHYLPQLQPDVGV